LSQLSDRVSGGVAGLLGPGGPRLAEWLASGAARVVKQAPHRTVYRVVLPGLDFHLKQYPAGGRRARLRGLVRPSRARLEYERTLEVARRGVPTLEPLAVGETGDPFGGSSSYLLTRTLPGTVPLGSFLDALPVGWTAARTARFRQRLARALGRFLALMHDAGVVHRDLHPGNLLLRLDAGDRPRLYLIDLLAVRLGPPLGWRAARANLVILNRWFMLRSTRADRLRFWRSYRAARRSGGPPAVLDDRLGVRDLEERTLRSNLRFWRDSDRRCLGGNRHFRRVQGAGAAGYAVADLDQDTLGRLLAAPDAPFTAPGARVLKESATGSVVEFDLATAAGPRRVVCKRFGGGGWLRSLAALVRPTQALRSYVSGHALRLRCLPTPRPLAVWHRYRGGLPGAGYLLTEAVPEAADLRAFADRLAALPAAEGRPRLRRLIDQVARLVALLHQRHLSHRDLKAANVLVSPAPWRVDGRGTVALGPVPPAGGADQVWFIDLVGVRRHGKLRRGRRVQNLARLHASFLAAGGLTRADRLRFLRAYLAWGLRGRVGWKRWWREVEEATKAKVRRNLRRGRPLA
jgi:tRNA A-37 threonylcarbamoyl transferase component Bud32